MGSEIRQAEARARAAWIEAVQASYENASGYVGFDYTFREWSRSVHEMYTDQWFGHDRHKDGGWDWPEISRRHRAIKDRTVALISEDRLSALAQIRVTKSRILVGFLEGDPRPDCHIKGMRALLMLDLASTYGQRLGKGEIHLKPLNGDLAELYRTKMGFVDGRDGSGDQVLKRSLS